MYTLMSTSAGVLPGWTQINRIEAFAVFKHSYGDGDGALVKSLAVMISTAGVFLSRSDAVVTDCCSVKCYRLIIPV